ncbi:hypothetical protein [Rhizobium sullae]|uniref:Uncharacterized protein n=1 Tax=Rhizobium sullae TaxID=50338 RepID=A0A4R3QCV5_RHISU|nr:hypothetical protein EV132_104411 [Rhizobium sullae]
MLFASIPQLIEYSQADEIQISLELVIPESQNAKTLRSEMRIACLVWSIVGML